MTIADNEVDFVSAPKNYSDLFRVYYPFVVALVRKAGISDADKEDIASDILLRFFERDFLKVFDPDAVFEYDGQVRKARFKSFLAKFVLTYVRGLGDKTRRQAQREMLICDMPVGDAGDATWIDVFGGSDAHEDNTVDKVSYEQLVSALRAYLEKIGPRSKHDTCDLVKLFDAMVDLVDKYGELSITELQRKFRNAETGNYVSSTALHSWIWWLRDNAGEALNLPVPTKKVWKKVPA